MTDAAPKPAWRHVRRILSVLATLATFVGNVIPLYGVLYWQWDTFQLLMLFWMETAIIAFWTLMRLSRLPSGDRGEITVNGKPHPATQFALVGFFAIHSSAFIFGHLLFLWIMFSSEWLKKVHGVGSFFSELFVVNYVWVALVFLSIASAVTFYVDTVHRQASPAARAGQTQAANDPVGAIVAGLYGRIVIMQIAIIFGAMISIFVGSMAPLVIVIALKTIFDLGAGHLVPILKNMDFASKSKKQQLKIEM